MQLFSADGNHLLVKDPNGALQHMAIGGAPAPVKGVESWDDLLEWSPDLKSVTTADNRNIPVVVWRVNLGAGARTKISELTPRNPSGMLSATLQAFRDNGGQ